jgi:hypothetical protein
MLKAPEAEPEGPLTCNSLPHTAPPTEGCIPRPPGAVAARRTAEGWGLGRGDVRRG